MSHANANALKTIYAAHVLSRLLLGSTLRTLPPHGADELSVGAQFLSALKDEVPSSQIN